MGLSGSRVKFERHHCRQENIKCVLIHSSFRALRICAFALFRHVLKCRVTLNLSLYVVLLGADTNNPSRRQLCTLRSGLGSYCTQHLGVERLSMCSTTPLSLGGAWIAFRLAKDPLFE